MDERKDGSGGRENPGARIGTVRHNRAKPRRPSTPFVSRRAGSSHSGFPCGPPSAATTATAPCSPIQHRPGLVPPSFPEVTPSDIVDAPSRLVPSSMRMARAATTSLLASRSLNAVAPWNLIYRAGGGSQAPSSALPSPWGSEVIVCSFPEFPTGVHKPSN
jgi:hypothetical protein